MHIHVRVTKLLDSEGVAEGQEAIWREHIGKAMAQEARATAAEAALKGLRTIFDEMGGHKCQEICSFCDSQWGRAMDALAALSDTKEEPRE
jgi:hypothetical protein